MDGLARYRRMITEKGGVGTWPVHGLLYLLSLAYRLAVHARNLRYDAPGAVTHLPFPVISVGNLTTGGTGKTPFVADLLERLARLDTTPAVVARGYKSPSGEPNDEQRLILRSSPNVAYVADADRIRAARFAHERMNADVVVLDDGFQHRRLGRSLDIVLIDATCPFGFGHLLPRGLLREPKSSLARADVVVLTRCDQVSPQNLGILSEQVRSLAPGAAHLRCVHRMAGIEHLDGSRAEGCGSGGGHKRRAVLFAAIGNPESFRATAQASGFDVVHTIWWPDHHHYSKQDEGPLLRSSHLPEHDVLLTTEKDAVKLGFLGEEEKRRILVLKVAIDFMDGGGTILDRLLCDAIGRTELS